MTEAGSGAARERIAIVLLYVGRLVSSSVRVTRLARGLPVGSDIEYADDVTLARALENRQEV